MSHSEALENSANYAKQKKAPQKRRIVNAIWQPFLQFKLLMYMLGTTAVVAVLLAGFMYFAFSDLVSVVAGKTEATSYYAEMVEIQMVHLLRYCGALFVLYVALLATVCVAYTHRLIGPLRPFSKHVENLTAGDYSSRVHLRKGDLDMYYEYANKLNELAIKLNAQNAKEDKNES